MWCLGLSKDVTFRTKKSGDRFPYTIPEGTKIPLKGGLIEYKLLPPEKTLQEKQKMFKMVMSDLGFIPAHLWKTMTQDGIINSIEVALRVLGENKMLTLDQKNKLLTIIQDIAKILTESGELKLEREQKHVKPS